MADGLTEERKFGLRYLCSFEAGIGNLVALLAPLVVLLVKILVKQVSWMQDL